MAGIKIIAELFHGKFENLKVGAEWIRFSPSDRFEGGSVKFDIGTAGSIPLTLMTVIPAVSFSNNNLHIEITGGQTSKQAQQSIISSTLLQKASEHWFKVLGGCVEAWILSKWRRYGTNQPSIPAEALTRLNSWLLGILSQRL